MENGLLQLDQGGLASQAVTALLPQVVTPPGPFKPQDIANLLWALAKLVENGWLQLDQGGPGQPGGDGAVAAGAEPSGEFHFSNMSPTCCGRWQRWEMGSVWMRF